MMPVGQCMKYPPENLYRETTKNTTFPYKNTTGDITGGGKPDTSVTGAGLINLVPFPGALSLVGIVILGTLS